MVAPLAGAWIEIARRRRRLRERSVAPLAGAWIEISLFSLLFCFVGVAPLAGAWIEIVGRLSHKPQSLVAPLAGAWIEIGGYCAIIISNGRRSPCGSVD